MINNFLKEFNKKYIIVIFTIFIYFFIPYLANAASLSLSPSSNKVSEGNIFTIKVNVDTRDKYINNTDAIIQFPTDLLEVVSVSKSSSIFSLWVEEPSFSNITGRVTFNGGAATPGFIGSSGNIISITFKAKKEGTASILFSDSAVRENDGLGTDILTSKNGSVIQIENPAIVEAPKKIEKPVTTANKVVTIKEKKVEPVKKAEISKISKVFEPSISLENNQNIINLTDENTISNIDYYIIQIDNNPSFKVKKDELINNSYSLPALNEGGHNVHIITFDNSGKYTESSLNFASGPIPSPELSLSVSEITKNEDITISGKTNYPNKQVIVTLESEGKEIKSYSQTTSSDGSFTIVTDKIKTVGLINIYANLVLSDTVKSAMSERVYLKVDDTKVMNITLAILYPLVSLIIISILFIILIMVIYMGWHKFFGLKRKINRELESTGKDVHKAMLLLKEELNDQLIKLEKVKDDRVLNRKEEFVFNEIQKNIDDIDDFIDKKLKKMM